MVWQEVKGCCNPGFRGGEISHLQPFSAVHPHNLLIPLFGKNLLIPLLSHEAETLPQLPGDSNPSMIKALESGEDLKTSRARAFPFALDSSD